MFGFSKAKHRAPRLSLSQQAEAEAHRNVHNAAACGQTISFLQELQTCRLERGLEA